MNGPGIDDAESGGEGVSKNLPVRRAPAVGEKSLMDHSFLFAAAALLLAYPGDAGTGISTLSRDKEFMPANGILDYSSSCGAAL